MHAQMEFQRYGLYDKKDIRLISNNKYVVHLHESRSHCPSFVEGDLE